jgi:predicted component of type VI protein secretion system
MQAVLVMFRSDGDRRSFSLTRDITVVGRREDCDLRIPLGEVSRKHCRLVRDGDSLRLEDLGSSNGTFHNGQRVQEASLHPGDSVQVGPLVFVLQVDGMPADEELVPVQAQTSDQDQDAASIMAEDEAFAPTSQSGAGMQELPTIDEGLDELNITEAEPVESITEDDLGFDLTSEDATQATDEHIELVDDDLHRDSEKESPRH